MAALLLGYFDGGLGQLATHLAEVQVAAQAAASWDDALQPLWAAGAGALLQPLTPLAAIGLLHASIGSGAAIAAAAFAPAVD